MAANNKLLWAISYHHLCNDGTLMALIALVPILLDKMDLSYYEVGLLGFGLVITVVVQYGVGRIADRRFSRILLETGAGLMGLSFLLLLVVNDFTGLFAVVIVMRIGAAFYHPVGTSWISRAFAGSRLDTALGVQSGVGNIGVIVAWISSGYLGEYYSWKAPCVLWAGLNLSAIAVGLLVISRADATLSQLSQRERIDPKKTFRKIGLLSIPIVTGGALYQVTSYFGPLNLTEGDGWSPSTADLMFAFWIAVGTITSYYFGTISARYSRGLLLKAAYLASCASVLLLAVTNDLYLVTAILAFYGALLYVSYPAIFSFVTQATSEKERGTAFGILFGLQLGGGAATVYACGALAEVTGNPAYSFVVVAGMAAVSTAALVTWERGAGAKSVADH
jgi:FSR family fosmidomycin resistance protein-like MFS transporter